MKLDPIGFEGGINQYNYCSNNPIKYSDPEGLLLVAAAVITTAAVTAGIVYVTVKCLKDCAEEKPCDDPLDPEREANLKQCIERCMPFLSFLGWNTIEGIGTNISTEIGEKIGERISDEK